MSPECTSKQQCSKTTWEHGAMSENVKKKMEIVYRIQVPAASCWSSKARNFWCTWNCWCTWICWSLFLQGFGWQNMGKQEENSMANQVQRHCLQHAILNETKNLNNPRTRMQIRNCRSFFFGHTTDVAAGAMSQPMSRHQCRKKSAHSWYWYTQVLVPYPQQTCLSPTRLYDSRLYNTSLQDSSPTLVSNTSLQHSSPQHSKTLLANPSLQTSSPTLLFSNASLQHCSATQLHSVQHTSPTRLYKPRLQHFSSPTLL